MHKWQEAIKHFLVTKRISQTHLAALTGMPIETINRLIKNEKANPTLKSLQSIADVLGVTVGDIVDFKVESRPAFSDLSAEENIIIYTIRKFPPLRKPIFTICELFSSKRDITIPPSVSEHTEKTDRIPLQPPPISTYANYPGLGLS